LRSASHSIQSLSKFIFSDIKFSEKLETLSSILLELEKDHILCSAKINSSQESELTNHTTNHIIIFWRNPRFALSFDKNSSKKHETDSESAQDHQNSQHSTPKLAKTLNKVKSPQTPQKQQNKTQSNLSSSSSSSSSL